MTKQRLMSGAGARAVSALLFGGGLAVSAASMAAAEGLTEAELTVAQANFEAADADQSGGLTSDEFRVFIDANAEEGLGRASRIKSRGAYDRAFSALDADQDQAVTWPEFSEAGR